MSKRTTGGRRPDDAGGTTRLVTVPQGGSVMDATCPDTWSQAGPRSTGVVWVTDDAGPDAVLAELRDSPQASMPATIDVITVGDSVRSATAQGGNVQSTAVPFEPSELSVHALPDAEPLSALGEAILDSVEAVERADRDLVVCFDAMSPLVEAHELQTVFQFIHVLTARIRSRGGTLHVAVDPDTLDQSTLSILEPLFDDLVSGAA